MNLQPGEYLLPSDEIVVDVRSMVKQLLGSTITQDDSVDAFLCELGKKVLASTSDMEQCLLEKQIGRLNDIRDIGDDRGILILMGLGIFLALWKERQERIKYLAEAVH